MWIKTERLTLRPYLSTLVTDKHIKWLNDPFVMKYSEQRHYNHTLETQKDYVLNMSNPFWLIYWGDVDIGTIKATPDRYNEVAEIGILIGDRREWGRGYATEAWSAVMTWCYDNGMRKIEAGCMGLNTGMIKVFEKTGMKWEGCRGDHFIYGNKVCDMVLYGSYRHCTFRTERAA